jgi:hypothetical protein
MEPDFIQWLVGQSGLAGLAALALWMMNRVWRERAEELQRDHERECQEYEARLRETMHDREVLLEALNRNTAAIAKFQETLEAFLRSQSRKDDNG